MFKSFIPLCYPLALALAEAVRIADRDGRQRVEVIDLMTMLGWRFKKRRSSFGSAWRSAVKVAPSKDAAGVLPVAPGPALTEVPLDAASELRGALAIVRERGGEGGAEALAAYSADVRRLVTAAVEASRRARTGRPSAAHLLAAMLDDPVWTRYDLALAARLGMRPDQLREYIARRLPTRQAAIPYDFAAQTLDRYQFIRPSLYSFWKRLRWSLREGRLDAQRGIKPGSTWVFEAVSRSADWQSIRLGHDTTGLAHLLPAILGLHEYLAASQRRMADTSDDCLNRAAHILADHGLTYRLVYDALATMTIDWRALQAGPDFAPRVSQEFLDAAPALRSLDLEARGHDYAGTTAILAGILQVPGSTARILLRHLALDPDEIKAAAVRQLPDLRKR